MKELILSNSCLTALVDDSDFNLVKEFKWDLLANGYIRGYIPYEQKLILLHRFLLNIEKGQEIDHINRNKLDNRRENLRICSHLQNCQNRNGVDNIGVRLRPSGMYQSYCYYNRKYYHVGTFSTKHEAFLKAMEYKNKYLNL